MYYCGLDLHAKSSTFSVLNQRGRRVAEGVVPTSRRGFKVFLDRLERTPLRVVLEASTRTRWAAQVLERLGAEVVVVDPRKVRVIAETKHKTDRTDARILADLLRTGALPRPLWRVPQSTRVLRDQMRLRWGLVRARATILQRARFLVASVGITLGMRAFDREGIWDRLMRRREVPNHMKELLKILQQCAAELSKAIAEVEHEYSSRLEDPIVRRLQEIPGVGPIVALTTVAELGDPGRFKDSRAAAAYTGLVPSEYSSGQRRQQGHITKRGPSQLRRVWVQAAQAVMRMRSHPLQPWVHRLIYRRGRRVAVVALARRLFRWAFAIWRDQRKFNRELAVRAVV